MPRGTAFERIDPATLSATWALNGVDHRLWGAPTGEEVVRTDDGRIRSIGLHFRDGNRAAVVRGRLNGGGPEWIGVAARANGAIVSQGVV